MSTQKKYSTGLSLKKRIDNLRRMIIMIWHKSNTIECGFNDVQMNLDGWLDEIDDLVNLINSCDKPEQHAQSVVDARTEKFIPTIKALEEYHEKLPFSTWVMQEMISEWDIIDRYKDSNFDIPHTHQLIAEHRATLQASGIIIRQHRALLDEHVFAMLIARLRGVRYLLTGINVCTREKVIFTSTRSACPPPHGDHIFHNKISLSFDGVIDRVVVWKDGKWSHTGTFINKINRLLDQMEAEVVAMDKKAADDKERLLEELAELHAEPAVI